jgi:glucose/arabinose dehydrogenase
MMVWMRTRNLWITLVSVVALAAPLLASPAASAAKRIRLARIGTFDQPTYLTAPPGSRTRQFVTERDGVIRVRRNGRRLATPFLDIRDLVDTEGEGGLLSMAFSPGYNSNRRFYVYFIDSTGDVRIEEFKRSRGSRDRAVRNSRRRVLVQRHRASGNHKGGQLQFGPDEMLYAAIGDGGGGGDPFNNAQNLGTLLGKLIRIDPLPTRGRRYRIPRGNPFRSPGGARGEIYGYGLRNPYRFSFDRRTGNLALSDVGQSEVEEVSFVRRFRGRSAPRAGVNFGWSVFEGRRRFKSGTARNHLRPALQRFHRRDGVCSITGGYVVRDRKLIGLRGRYIYGDLCVSRLRHARLRHPSARGDRASGLRVASLVSFGEDAFGRVYAVSLDGPVYRLVRR